MSSLPSRQPETVHGAFIAHMQLAFRWLMRNNPARQPSDARLVRVMDKHTADELREMLAGGR